MQKLNSKAAWLSWSCIGKRAGTQQSKPAQRATHLQCPVSNMRPGPPAFHNLFIRFDLQLQLQFLLQLQLQ